VDISLRSLASRSDTPSRVTAARRSAVVAAQADVPSSQVWPVWVQSSSSRWRPIGLVDPDLYGGLAGFELHMLRARLVETVEDHSECDDMPTMITAVPTSCLS
jgi:hypothetical protein